MKKLLIALIISITTLLLIGCGKSSTDNSTVRADWKVETKEDLQQIKEKNKKITGENKKLKKAMTRADWGEGN